MRRLVAATALVITLVATPAALADGRIAFMSRASGNEDVWTIDPTGAGGYPTDLTNGAPGVDQSPSWSPDGTRIAFISDRAGGFDVWLMDADGSNPVQLTHDGGSTATPAWSPDATQIAFASTRLTGSWAIWAIGADGSGLHRVSPGFGVDPAWSPDGSQLAYVSFDALHVMNMDGSGDHMITSGSLPDSAPAWSPDGSRIAFGRYRADWQTSNVKEIWTVRPDGTQEAMLTGFGAYSDHPSWSPDGSRIVFQVSGPAGDSTLVTATPDGRDISVPPNTPPLSFGPSWGSAAPSIDLRSPRDGAVLAQNSVVFAHYSCGPTAVSCVGTLPDLTPLDTARTGQFTFSVTATDAAGRHATVSAKYRVVDMTPPSVLFRTPCCDNPVYQLGATVATDFSCDDGPYGSGVELCSGDPYLDTSTVGQHSFVVQTRDGAGNAGSSQQPYRVVWPFSFGSPIMPPPTYNPVRSGEGVPVKFFLGGDRGLDVIDSVFFITVDCDTGAGLGTSGALGKLSYNASQARYTYLWQTDRSQSGTCARLVLGLHDGSWHEAWFRFSR